MMVSEVIEDTIITIRRLDHARWVVASDRFAWGATTIYRLEYDANRNELLHLQVEAQSGDDDKVEEMQAAQEATNELERKYEQLKEDVQVVLFVRMIL